MIVSLADHLKAMERSSLYADFVPVAASPNAWKFRARVAAIQERPLPKVKTETFDLFGQPTEAQLQEDARQQQVEQAESIQRRQAAAFKLLGQGMGITAVAKTSGAQVNQLYDWMATMAINGPPATDAVEITPEEWKVAEARCFKESIYFRRHLQDRLAEGDEPEEIMGSYGLSAREFQRLTAEQSEPRPAEEMSQIEPLLEADFRYDGNLPFNDDKDLPEIPSLRDVADYLEANRRGSDDRMETAVFHLERNGLLPERRRDALGFL